MASVRFTENFAANLASTDCFLEEAGADPSGFAALVDHLFDVVVPTLAAHPRLGADVLARRPRSVEVETIEAAVRTRLGAGELRQYVARDYVVLYSHHGDFVDLLAIKHHRQLSFDFMGFRDG